MNNKKSKKKMKILKSFLLMLLISTVLLLIHILIININGPYYGNWFKKYVSFLIDNSISPYQKSIIFYFVGSVLAVIFYSIKILIQTLNDKK